MALDAQRIVMSEREAAWARHHAAWRDTAQVTSQWEDAAAVDPALLRARVRGAFWETLERARMTLLVTREYEHLVMGLSVVAGAPHLTYMRLPHPSGLVCDPSRRVVHIASTRNPNQILELAPVTGLKPRRDVALERFQGRPLVPVSARYYPGSTYLHDLSLVGGVLHANAVGDNAVVRVERDGTLRRVFWPRAIESRGKPRFDQNYIQLNSIAAGDTIETSFFSASADKVSARRPGHRDFPVDRRGVIYSGETREPVARGLTRPHSARLHRKRLWVANSGYGELGVIENGRFESVLRVDAWTRGLAFTKNHAFFGASHVLPRFRRYAPGLDADKSYCGVHVLELRTGKIVGSLTWPNGNQIFGIECVPRSVTSGFPFSSRHKSQGGRARKLFYAFETGASAT